MTMDQINARLDELKDQKTRIEGLETEVYARIVGYYRSVRNWNKGKKEEYGKRINYGQFETLRPSAAEAISTAPLKVVVEEKSQNELSFSSSALPSQYLYFFRKTCPNCPPVAQWLEQSDMEGRSIDVDRESGMHEAVRYDVTAAPTVILLDESGVEMGRGSSVSILEAQVGMVAAAGA